MAEMLKDKVIIVTGAGRGVGECIAEYCANQGARVVVNDLGKDENGKHTAEIVADRIIANGGQAIAALDSVAEMAGAVNMVKNAVDKWGRIDGLVNNAAIFRSKPFLETSLEDYPYRGPIRSPTPI